MVFAKSRLHANVILNNPSSQKMRIYNLCFGLNFLLCYFRLENTGNCLYSSISLLLVGDNSLVESLHCLTILKLHQHASF